MRKLAIGILAAAGVAMGLALPVNAQGVWVGAGPVGVGIGAGPGWGYHDYGPGYRSYAYDNDFAYARHCRTFRDDFGRLIRHCR